LRCRNLVIIPSAIITTKTNGKLLLVLMMQDSGLGTQKLLGVGYTDTNWLSVLERPITYGNLHHSYSYTTRPEYLVNKATNRTNYTTMITTSAITKLLMLGLNHIEHDKDVLLPITETIINVDLTKVTKRQFSNYYASYKTQGDRVLTLFFKLWMKWQTFKREIITLPNSFDLDEELISTLMAVYCPEENIRTWQIVATNKGLILTSNDLIRQKINGTWLNWMSYTTKHLNKIIRKAVNDVKEIPIMRHNMRHGIRALYSRLQLIEQNELDDPKSDVNIHILPSNVLREIKIGLNALYEERYMCISEMLEWPEAFALLLDGENCCYMREELLFTGFLRMPVIMNETDMTLASAVPFQTTEPESMVMVPDLTSRREGYNELRKMTRSAGRSHCGIKIMYTGHRNIDIVSNNEVAGESSMNEECNPEDPNNILSLQDILQ
jgi:hypothetical protein